MSLVSKPLEQRYLAQAKINLALSVTGRQANGYHDLAMINARLTLCDELTFKLTDTALFTDDGEAATNKVNASLNVIIEAPYIPANALSDSSKNIILSAIQNFDEVFIDKIASRFSIDVILQKFIPIGGGLGGGSTNAASALLFLYSYGLIAGKTKPVAVEDPLLLKAAMRTGADVPFFLYGIPTANVSGIGEKVIPLTDPSLPTGLTVILLVPQFSISTKEVFATYQELNQGYSTQAVIHKNDLLDAACLVEPRLQPLYEELINSCPASGLSGSGSTLYCLDPSIQTRKKLRSLSESFDLTLIETKIA